MKIGHHLLTLKLFQTYMNIFSVEHNILKNVSKQTVYAAIDFHSICFPYGRSQWLPSTFG